MADIPKDIERRTAFSVVHGEPQLIDGNRVHYVRIVAQVWSEPEPAVAECNRLRAVHPDAIVLRTETYF